MTTRFYADQSWTDGNGTFVQGSIYSSLTDSQVNIYINQGRGRRADGLPMLTPVTTTSSSSTSSISSSSGNTIQTILFSALSSLVDLSAGNIVNVSDLVTTDVTIPAPINPTAGLVGYNWKQDGVGGHVITLPNGTTISGGLPNEYQSALFLYNGVNYIKLANG